MQRKSGRGACSTPIMHTGHGVWGFGTGKGASQGRGRMLLRPQSRERCAATASLVTLRPQGPPPPRGRALLPLRARHPPARLHAQGWRAVRHWLLSPASRAVATGRKRSTRSNACVFYQRMHKLPCGLAFRPTQLARKGLLTQASTHAKSQPAPMRGRGSTQHPASTRHPVSTHQPRSG